MMTNGEHDTLWIGGAKSLPMISNSLRRANGLAAFKELYTLGVLSEDLYKQVLLDILELENFDVRKVLKD